LPCIGVRISSIIRARAKTMNKCGIYQIENTANGKVYIGRAVDIARRWNEHRYNLKNNQHVNVHLQGSYNKHGKDAFRFSVIEECSKDVIMDREILHIMSFPIEMTYNMGGDYGNGVLEYSPETRKKMSKALTGREVTRETREKLSDAMAGRKFSKETRAKMAAAKTGRKGNRLGYKTSKETKAKLSAMAMGRKVTQETKEKLSRVNKGKPWSAARRAAQEAPVTDVA